MKTLLALAVLATASLTTTASANDVSDFDFASQATMLDQGPVIDLDTTEMGNTKPLHHHVIRSIRFAVVARGHKPDQVFSKITEAAATMCRKHKGAVRNLNYFAVTKASPRDGSMIELEGASDRVANALGVRVSCTLGDRASRPNHLTMNIAD